MSTNTKIETINLGMKLKITTHVIKMFYIYEEQIINTNEITHI